MTKFCESRHLMKIDSLGKLDGKLKNIANGLITPDKVNITDVKNCGEIIINKMEGTFPLTYSFNRIIQAVPMPTSSDILNKKDPKVSLDPELLFQRLITISSDDDQNDALKYELAQYPMSLFNDAGFMRDSKKHELGNHIAEQYTIHDVIPDISSESWKKVVDGAMLLHKLP